MPPKISVIVPTVLGDYPIWSLPKVHILDYVPSVIASQDFDLNEIEVIVMDALWEYRPDFFDSHDYPFEIIHAPPARGWVLEHRKTNHALLRNTALSLASGELVFLVDDTLSFGSSMLSSVWREYESGYALSPLVEWRCGSAYSGSNVDWRVNWMISNGFDRWATDTNNDPFNPIGFGIIAYPLKTALDIGGYDESYDGSNQYIDTTFGIRMALYGAETGLKGIVVDRKYWCRHEAHELPDPRVLITYNPELGSQSMFHGAVHCNRTIYLTQRRLGFPRRVNVALPSREMYGFFQRCPYYKETRDKIDTDGLPSNQTCEGSNLPCKLPWIARQGETVELQEWVRNLRTYDLREWRRVVRANLGLP